MTGSRWTAEQKVALDTDDCWGDSGTPARPLRIHRVFRQCRATRRSRKPPSDAEIEHGSREREVSDPRAAEILLRWLQRPRAEERVEGVDLASMSERELDRLYNGLLKLAALPERSIALSARSVTPR
jgi:hypothetical protein